MPAFDSEFPENSQWGVCLTSVRLAAAAEDITEQIRREASAKPEDRIFTPGLRAALRIIERIDRQEVR